MKKVLCLILTLAMCMCSAAVLAESDPAAQLPGSYFTYAFTAEGYGDYVYYFHFYEEQPVLGSVFYAGFCNNQANFAGTYTVEAAEFAYNCYPDRLTSTQGPDYQISGVAPYTITFYDWDGNVIDQCGYDGQIIYNDMTVITGSGASPLNYERDADPANSKYVSAYEAEFGMNYLSFVGVEDNTCTLQLSHNGTYVDLMNYYLDGRWEMIAREDGGFDYTLTPADETEQPASVSVSVDKQTAVYTDAEGNTFDMINEQATGPKAVYGGEASQMIESMGTDAAIALTLFDDSSCVMNATVYGSEGELDKGTYTMNADYTITFAFDNAGEITSALNYETYANVLTYTLNHERMGEINVDIAIGKIEEAVPAEVLFSFTGGYTTLDIYDDNTYTFAFESYGLTEQGNWAFDSAAYAFTLTQAGGNVIAASINGDTHALELTYTAEANAQLVDNFTCESSIWGPALTK